MQINDETGRVGKGNTRKGVNTHKERNKKKGKIKHKQ